MSSAKQHLETARAREQTRREQQGLGRPIVSTTLGDYRFVAVGETLQASKKWRFPTDFLTDYLAQTLGRAWGFEEIQKPVEDQHPIVQWYGLVKEYERSQRKTSEGVFSARATGAVWCYLGLAYGLYLLKHNVALQSRFVARLKNKSQFQGAYFELIVASCFIRAGFQLSLEDEADPAVKHCEFSAVSPHTNRRYWVEAKMKSLAGLLGKTSVDGAKLSSKPTSQMTRHISEALKKPARDTRMIFVDVNATHLAPNKEGHVEPPDWISAAERQLESRERDLKPDERAYVFVSSFPFHRALDVVCPPRVVLPFGLGIANFCKPGAYRLSELWRRKQEHMDAFCILEAMRSYPNIPTTFDGSLPLSPEAALNHLTIGQTYEFIGADGTKKLGKVMDATVFEGAKEAIYVIQTENGSEMRSRPMTDEELEVYRTHRDTYFGVVRRAGRRIDDPYELFEWMVECYSKTPRSKLLEFVKDHPYYDLFESLDDLSLRLEVCEGWVASSLNKRNPPT